MALEPPAGTIWFEPIDIDDIPTVGFLLYALVDGNTEAINVVFPNGETETLASHTNEEE